MRGSKRLKNQNPQQKPQIFILESSSSDSSDSESEEEIKITKPQNSRFKRTRYSDLSTSQPNIQTHPVDEDENGHENENRREVNQKNVSIPRIQSIPAVNHPQPLRLLDRYRSNTPRASCRLQLIPIEKRINHFKVHREKEWHGATYSRVFSMYSLDKPSSNPIAKATFASTFSQEIKVVNPNGLICEIDTDADGKYQMRLGNDVSLSMRKDAGDAIFAEFFAVDGVIPPFKLLTSPPGACVDLKAAFGERKALKSIKNCKLCFNGDEIVAVRKVSKNDVEVDAKGTISFLACFTIAIFMYVQ